MSSRAGSFRQIQPGVLTPLPLWRRASLTHLSVVPEAEAEAVAVAVHVAEVLGQQVQQVQQVPVAAAAVAAAAEEEAIRPRDSPLRPE